MADVAVAAEAGSFLAATVRFDGVNDFVESPTTTVMNGVPLTLEAWVKPALRSDGTDFPSNVISNDNPTFAGHGFGVNVWAGGSQLKVESQAGFRVVPGVSFSAEQWVHVAVVYTPGNAKTYVNGVLVNEAFDAYPQQGRIQLQTELAEIFFRRWELHPLDQAPKPAKAEQ